MSRILIVLSSEERRGEIQLALGGQGCSVDGTDSTAAARELLVGHTQQPESVDAVMCSVELIEELGPLPDGLPLIALAQRGCAGDAVAAFDRGAVDGLLLPVVDGELKLCLGRLRQLRRLKPTRLGVRKAPVATEPPASFSGMIGSSRPMREVFSTIERLARHKANVLLTGESGTGKELVARAIHERSPRTGGRFVAINCGAIPATLLESELFGHVRGAFTGACRDKPGLFEQADGGTLFLDEIGELQPALQVKLLRVLQESEVRRVGANTSTLIDVRVIAATLRDLNRAIETGEFREDLFYRLNVLPIELPPLRERPEDIPALVEHFVDSYGRKAKKQGLTGTCATSVSPQAMQVLCGYPWPGNIRELENTIERAMVLTDQDVISASILEPKLRQAPSAARADGAQTGLLAADELSIKKTTRRIEQELIARALASTKGNRTNAAKLLEISHRALLYKIKEYGL